jgi:hypothetical protein
MSGRLGVKCLAEQVNRKAFLGEDYVGSWCAQLTLNRLSDLTGLGDPLISALRNATEAYELNPTAQVTNLNLEHILMAIRLTGVAWEPELLPDFGYSAIWQSLEVVLANNNSRLAINALWTLTHFAPLFTCEQCEEISNPHKISPSEDSKIRVNAYLLFAAPIQRLIEEGHDSAYQRAVESLSSALVIIERAVSFLSDPSNHPELSSPTITVTVKRAIHSVCMLIPELAKSLEEQNRDDIAPVIDRLVNGLSWFITASERMNWWSSGGEANFLAGESSRPNPNQFKEFQHLSWVALALILRRGSLWADDFVNAAEGLRKEARRALTRLALYFTEHPTSFPIRMFLALVGEDDFAYSEEQALDFANMQLRFYSNLGVKTNYSDTIASAALAWIESIDGRMKGDWSLAQVVAEALAGRAFDVDSQAFLMRAAKFDR